MEMRDSIGKNRSSWLYWRTAERWEIFKMPWTLAIMFNKGIHNINHLVVGIIIGVSLRKLIRTKAKACMRYYVISEQLILDYVGLRSESWAASTLG